MGVLRVFVQLAVLSLLGIYLFFGLVYLLTGIRIKRVGYLSIRWIQWISRSERVTVEVRKIGLRPQRPTITRRTWLGIVVSDALITVRPAPTEDWGSDDDELPKPEEKKAPQSSLDDMVRQIGQMLGRFVQFRVLSWVDLELSSTTLVVEGAGTFQMGMFFIGMNSKPQMFKRERILSPAGISEDWSQAPRKAQPLEVTITIRDLYFSIDDKEFTEIAKTTVLTADFLLGGEYGVRDVKAALRIAGFSVPYDNFMMFRQTVSDMWMARPESAHQQHSPVSQGRPKLSFLDIFEELQIHITLLQISVNVPGVRPAGKQTLITLGLKDVGLDLIKLEKANVLDKLFNQQDLVEHQVLLTIISVAIDVNTDGRQGHGQQIFSVPLTTLAGKTCVLNRYINSQDEDNDIEAGGAVANIVITAPSTDLGPNHLQLLLALFDHWRDRPQFYTPPQSPVSCPTTPCIPPGSPRPFSLPKIGINLSIHEPSFRMLVHSNNGGLRMLVWSISNLLFEVHGQHPHLTENKTYQIQSSTKFGASMVHLWESDGKQLQILRAGSCEFKLFIPNVKSPNVESDVYLESIQVEINRTEIIDCVTRLVAATRFDLEPDRLPRRKRHHRFRPDRIFPEWIQRLTFEGREIDFVVAGPDERLSEEIRGMAIQFQSWIFNYNRDIHVGHKHSTRGHKKASFEARQFKILAVENQEHWDRDEPIFDTPEIHLSVSLHKSQKRDEIHLTVIVSDCLLGFSLFKLYAVCLSLKTLQRILKKPKRLETFERRRGSSSASSTDSQELLTHKPWILVVDGRSDLLRIRINLPEDQRLLFEASDIHVSRESYTDSLPYARSSFVRLHVQSPVAKDAWDRIVSIRGFRIERRDESRYIDTKKIIPVHFVIRTEAIRFRIPHQFMLYSVLESMKNAFKCSKQLLYGFMHDFASDFILSPQAEDAKRMPRMRIKSKCIILDLEDDPFEARLGFIYRVGGAEQQARMARDVAFDAKVVALENKREAWETRTSDETILEEGVERVDSEKPMKKEKSRRRLRRYKTKTETDNVSQTIHERRRSMRYQPEKAPEPSCEAEISIEEARKKLLEHNSQAWIRNFRCGLDTRAKQLETLREQLWGDDEISLLLQSHEKILPLPARPALFSIQLSHVDITLDKPACGFAKLPEFMHKTGGLPLDTQFTVLIPFHIKWTMNEVCVLLRDYPLPFIHIPPVHHSQHQSASTRLPAWSVETDVVIAEELHGEESIFRCDTVVIPPNLGGKPSPAFKISVPRTVSPVKFYSTLNVDINSSLPTKIVWGTSYQPALHDAMQVFDTFTKPQQDPSDKIGFWDKIRLIIHSDFKFNWKGGGDVHLTIKGSRNPYVVIGSGAGFMFCWRGDVVWKIATEPCPKDFSHVDSDEFILAIPDFTKEPIKADDYTDYQNSFTSSRVLSHDPSRNAVFRKVIMKLSGGVRWIAGAVLERRCPPNCLCCKGKGKCAGFDFIPHYDVHLKKPEYCRHADGEPYDSYRGFRSDFIHGSLSIISPRGSASKDGYNSIHLTPKAFAHFFAWWSLFSGVMSIPLRQGPLFPFEERSPKKFIRHLATIKYQLDLSPLYLTHTYRHKDSTDFIKHTTTITGIKARLDRLSLDVHQRKEEKVFVLKELQTKRRALHMGINRARVDFVSTDLRALTATLQDCTPSELHELSRHRHAPDDNESWGNSTIDLVNDEDLDWIDRDDFVEVDVVLSKSEPTGQIWPLAYGSRFTYYRSTDEASEPSMDNSGAQDSICPQFGSEDSHHCLMTLLEDPESVQYHLFRTRHEELISLLKGLETSTSPKAQERIDVIQSKISFLDALLQQSNLYFSDASTCAQANSELDKDDVPDDISTKRSGGLYPHDNTVGQDLHPALEESTHFKNRFIVHNLQLKWHNDVRNVIFNYIHQIGRRRGFIYYMSQKAIRFLNDIVREQQSQQSQQGMSTDPSVAESSIDDGDEGMARALDDAAQMIEQLLNDKKENFVAMHETQQTASGEDRFGTIKRLASLDLSTNLANLYAVKNEYSVQLVAPQIQLQSQKNVDAAVIMSAESIYLQIFAVMDKESIDDEVGGLIQRRFRVGMDEGQFFVVHRKHLDDFCHQSLLSNVYGANSAQWPPWIPVEVVYDFNADPLPFTRMVERTSASMRYDKHNPLRLKLSDQVNDDIFRPVELPSLTPPDRRVDDISVHFPRVVVTADSAQYYALYLIVTDLLIYSEPLVKRQNVELEKIMLSSDFSDLTGSPEMVKTLQNRIRQLEEIDIQFRVNSHTLDEEGCRDQVLLRDELNNCEEEIFFLMKAVTMSQEKHDSEIETVPTMRWYLSAREIIWHMLCDDKSPMVDLGLSNATYRRHDNSDSSNHNTLEIEMMQGINLLPNSLYTDVLGPYFSSHRTVVDAQRSKMVRVYWHMLESIGGIPIMDHFEVNLFPLMIKIEHEFGRKVFSYMFPEPKVSPRHGESTSKRHHQDADDSDSESDLDLLEHSVATSSNTSLVSSSSSKPTTPRRPGTASGSNLKRMTSLDTTGDESQATETMSLSSHKSDASDQTKRLPVSRHDHKDKNKLEKTDDVSQMLSRASRNITLIYVKFPTTVLCLSYKAPKGKSIEDVQNFVFTMPTLEYRNRTWSYMDLAMHLKKDVFKAILSHSGMLIRDKMSFHRKNKPHPNQMVRQLTSYRSYTHLNDLLQDSTTGISSSEPPSRKSTESLPTLRRTASQLSIPRTNPGFLLPVTSVRHEGDDEKGSAIRNALTRHLRHISHLARHRDGIVDESDESNARKSKILLGNFGGK